MSWELGTLLEPRGPLTSPLGSLVSYSQIHPDDVFIVMSSLFLVCNALVTSIILWSTKNKIGALFTKDK